MATPGPFVVCPDNRAPHLENRIGMASQNNRGEMRRLGHERTQRLVNPWPACCGGANPPRRTISTQTLRRALDATWWRRLPVEQKLASSILVGGANPSPHQGRLTR